MKHTSFPKVKTEKRPKTYSTAPPMSGEQKYKLIPLSEITDEAREIAVAWCENYQRMGFDIRQKHKLASDIMNYSDKQNAALKESLAELIKIADYYHDREVTYTDMPYKNWTAAIDRAKKLIAENRE